MGTVELALVLAHTGEDQSWSHVAVELGLWTGTALLVILAVLAPFWVRARLSSKNRS